MLVYFKISMLMATGVVLKVDLILVSGQLAGQLGTVVYCELNGLFSVTELLR